MKTFNQFLESIDKKKKDEESNVPDASDKDDTSKFNDSDEEDEVEDGTEDETVVRKSDKNSKKANIVATNESLELDEGVVDSVVSFLNKIGDYATGESKKRVANFVSNDLPKINDALDTAEKMVPYFKSDVRDIVKNQIKNIRKAIDTEEFTTQDIDSIASACKRLQGYLTRYMSPQSKSKLKNPKIQESEEVDGVDCDISKEQRKIYDAQTKAFAKDRKANAKEKVSPVKESLSSFAKKMIAPVKDPILDDIKKLYSEVGKQNKDDKKTTKEKVSPMKESVSFKQYLEAVKHDDTEEDKKLIKKMVKSDTLNCLLYTSDAADE